MDMVNASALLSRDEVLVDLVSFKWLMVDLGCWVDLPRMQHDAAYACECATWGLLARSSVLQQRSRELLAMLKAPVSMVQPLPGALSATGER
jgi:hypothetical protein